MSRIASGSVFQKTYTDREGRSCKTATFYLKYYVQGKPVVVSSGTGDYDDAVTMLRVKMADAARYNDYSDQPERARVNQLFDLLLDDYRYKGRKTTKDTEDRVEKHLRPFFGELKAQSVTTTKLKEYVKHRRAMKKGKNSKTNTAPATINKELNFLRRAMNLGAQHDPPLVLRVPHFEMLPVDNAREGVIEDEAYRNVRDRLLPHARIALVIAYHTGARKGEIQAIRIDKIDLKRKRIDLPGRTTKNGHPRFLPIYGDMKAELDMALSAASKSKCPYLIQQDGERVRDWKKNWATACKNAEVTEALFHDTRRTALTNMIEAGFSEKEAMEISGHRTRSVFDRYHIVSDRRMKQNVAKLEEHMKAKSSVQDSGARQETVLN